jgi:hypothetical protein
MTRRDDSGRPRAAERTINVRNLSTIVLAMASAVLLLLAPATRAAGPAKDGKALFTSFKGNLCHAVESQGIAVVEEEGEEPEAEPDDGARKPPDLSNVGSERDAKWLKDWLMKKVEVEGRTHRKKLTAEPSELNVLTAWLATLKTPPKK